MTTEYPLPYLRAGDVIAVDGKICHVLRVNDCAAVISTPQPPRTIRPRFGRPVTIQPSPKIERISANSCAPILHRRPTTN